MSLLTEEIKQFLKKEYSEDWMTLQKSERVYDYIDEDEAEPYDGDYEETYDNLCTGRAIETDIFEEIAKDIKDRFKIDIYSLSPAVDQSEYDEWRDYINSLMEEVFPFC